MAEKLASLSLHEICKSYRQGNTICTILDRMSFTFHQGAAYAITGVSGIGKSTLLHMLGGIEKPDTGTLDTSRAQIGYLFQNPTLIDELSVIENVMIKALIEHRPYESAYAFASELLERVGLSAYAQSSSKRLSGGEQQRVAVARALFCKPAFIIADEPTSHLDNENARTIIELLLESKQRAGAGIIIASHDPYVASRMDHVLTLAGGKLYGAAS